MIISKFSSYCLTNSWSSVHSFSSSWFLVLIRQCSCNNWVCLGSIEVMISLESSAWEEGKNSGRLISRSMKKNNWRLSILKDDQQWWLCPYLCHLGVLSRVANKREERWVKELHGTVLVLFTLKVSIWVLMPEAISWLVCCWMVRSLVSFHTLCSSSSSVIVQLKGDGCKVVGKKRRGRSGRDAPTL